MHLKTFLFYFFLASSTSLLAQQGFVTAGNEIRNHTGSVSFSLSQVAYTNTGNSAFSISHGIQQTYEITTAVSTLDKNLHLTVSPNPAQHILTISLLEYKPNTYHYTLYDVLGQKLIHNKLINVHTQVDLHHLQSNTYFLHIVDEKKAFKSFKIIKIN